MRIILSAALAAVALGFVATPGHAQNFGNAPWCAVINLGAGEIVSDCEYWSAAECAPNVVAGNRGFCNLNPYWKGPIPAGPPGPPAPHRKHHHVKGY